MFLDFLKTFDVSVNDTHEEKPPEQFIQKIYKNRILAASGYRLYNH